LKSIVTNFAKSLTNIKYPNKFEGWHIEGMLKKSNQSFKFDVREMQQLPNNQLGKRGHRLTKAEKMVFDGIEEWIILDINEIHRYLKKTNSRILSVNDLIHTLEWTMFVPKD
tara:strand:+ start:1027 stop:1362 length:336 start_codon:yes stop_codon:yes gene_type:complete